MINSVSPKALGRLIDLRAEDMKHLNLYRSMQSRKTASSSRAEGQASGHVPARMDASSAILAAVTARNQRAINTSGLDGTRSEISRLLARAKSLADANVSGKLLAADKEANQRRINSILSRVARIIDDAGQVSSAEIALKLGNEIRAELLRQSSTPEQAPQFSALQETPYSVLA